MKFKFSLGTQFWYLGKSKVFHCLKSISKHGRFDQEVILCVWWKNEEWFIKCLFRAVKQSMNLYSEQLERIYATLRQNNRHSLTERSLLQQNNIKPRTGRITRNKLLEQLEATVQIQSPTPGYRPGLDLWDYNLFCSMVHFLCSWYSSTMRKWKRQWRRDLRLERQELVSSRDQRASRKGLQTVKCDSFCFECLAVFVVARKVKQISYHNIAKLWLTQVL